jgi:L-glyceraldehyde 3-phosphate reductase
MVALADIVRQGKALYVGISNYGAEDTQKASEILKNLNVPFILHQARYSMFDRWVEDGLLNTLEKNDVGCIAFSPLAQGMLTDKYLKGIPRNSRAGGDSIFLNADTVNSNIEKVQLLDAIAQNRGQKLSQMAISWILRQKQVASVLIGASSTNQLLENVKSLEKLDFTEEELRLISRIV